MIVITGATGRTGRPAAEALLAKGEKVRVIGRDAKKLLDAAIDFYREYSSAAEQSRAAASHRG